MEKENRKSLTLLLIAALIFISSACLADSVTVDHRWGRTTINETPKRIVSLSFTGIDTLLALGIKPISYRTWFGGNQDGLWPWATQRMHDTSGMVILRGEITPEEIARLRPDFVEAMYSGISQAQYSALSRVAPVLPASKGDGDFGSSWDNMLRNIGLATGRIQKAEQVIAQIEQSIAAIRRRHPDWIGKSAVVAQPNGPLIFSEADPRMALLIRLGFQLPDAAQAFSLGNFYFKLDRELTEPLDADVLLWMGLQNDFSALDNHPLRHTLNAVRSGREIFLDRELSAALSFSSPLSIPYVLKRLEPMLEKALANPLKSRSLGIQKIGPSQ